jgi:CNT family concentrative nucleoside transporter
MWQSLLGLMVLPCLAWMMAEERRRPDWRMLIGGITLQFALALLLIKSPQSKAFFAALNDLVLQLDAALASGTTFVFGYLGGGPAPFEVTAPGAEFVLAFRALPLVILISALSALLYHWRILPMMVAGFSWLLTRIMGVGGALGLSTAANVFVGMVEAPLLVRPYLKQMSRSDLFAMMTCGMATVAGTMMVLYAQVISSVVPDAMGHILTASLISAPAALVIARLMVPPARSADEREQAATLAALSTSSMDAITRGTLDGLKLLLNIVAMLVVFIALVHIVNALLALLPNLDESPVTLQRVLGWCMAPLVWLSGIPWDEAVEAGGLMGIKTVLNELLAYLSMAQLPADALSERSRLIMTYVLCGFANFGSLGIMIGGLSTIVPERRQEILSLGMRSIAAGTLATSMTGAVVGLLV